MKTGASHSWINLRKPAWKFRMWSKSTCSQKWKKSEKLTGHTEYSLTNFQYEVHPVYDRNWNAESYFEKIVKSHKENRRRCISGEFFHLFYFCRGQVIRRESRPKRHRRWNPDDFWNETSIWTTKASLIRYFILQFYLWGRGFSQMKCGLWWQQMLSHIWKKVHEIRFLFIVPVWRDWKW